MQKNSDSSSQLSDAIHLAMEQEIVKRDEIPNATDGPKHKNDKLTIRYAVLTQSVSSISSQ